MEYVCWANVVHNTKLIEKWCLFLETYLVLPASPSPTNISFVLRHSVKPPWSLFKYAFTESNPLPTTSRGGVLNDGQLCRLIAERRTKHHYAFSIVHHIITSQFSKLIWKYFQTDYIFKKNHFLWLVYMYILKK